MDECSSHKKIAGRLNRLVAARQGGHDDQQYAATWPILINNLEVMELMQKKLNKRESDSAKKRNRQHRHRDWIEQEVVSYVNSSAAMQLQTARQADTLHSTICRCQSEAGFDLTEAEAMQVVNCVPERPVELHLLVEDLHNRMTSRQQDELLSTIKKYCQDVPRNDCSSKTSRSGMMNGDSVDEVNNEDLNGKSAACAKRR